MDNTIHKSQCSRCGATENLTAYRKHKRADGVVTVYYICNPCNNERRRKWYATHKAEAQAYNTTYRHKKQTQ